MGGRMKKGNKRKQTSICYLLHPENLQKKIDSYGYSFSMGRYVMFLFTALAGAVGGRNFVFPALVFYTDFGSGVSGESALFDFGWI